jgi:hypothetical protein
VLDMSFAVSAAAVLTLTTACTGICLVSVDDWPRVAAHGPNGGRSTRTAPCTRLGPSAACGHM